MKLPGALGEATLPSAARAVLVVEDEAQMRTMLEDNLQFDGYRVTAVPSGEDALDALERQAYSLVLLDVRLPGLSGFDVCRRMRSRELRVPVIMLTARTQEADRVEGLDVGADDYVSKPFSVRELLARVRAQVRRDDWHSAAGDEFTIGDLLDPAAPTARAAARTPRAALGTRVRAAAISDRAPQRGRQPRAAPARRLGLSRGDDHADRRQLRRQAAHAARAAPTRSSSHRDRPRQRVSAHWLMR
ncbi:MAG: response regulator [Vicinamibacterales bacterium]